MVAGRAWIDGGIIVMSGVSISKSGGTIASRSVKIDGDNGKSEIAGSMETAGSADATIANRRLWLHRIRRLLLPGCEIVQLTEAASEQLNHCMKRMANDA